MKSAVLPPIRVEESFRAEIQSVLGEGESLSSFVEETLRRAVEHRRIEQEFHARGEASMAEFRHTGRAHGVDEAFAAIDRKIADRRRQVLGR